MDLTLTRRLVAAACIATAFGAAAPAHAHDAADEQHAGTADRSMAPALRDARKATQQYRTPQAAAKAGYVLDSQCVEQPGVGGMGFHAVNEKLIADGKLEARRPEILVYAKNRRDRLRLVALEYFAPDPDGDPSTDDRPRLFGQPFDGPFGGPGEPPVYLLHAWVHKRNPAGVFAPFNPRVAC